MKDIELYSIIVLGILTLWLIINTFTFARGRKKIVKNLHRYAKEGELEAQSKLAACYDKGDVVIQDSLKASFWYQKAAFINDDRASTKLNAILKD